MPLHAKAEKTLQSWHRMVAAGDLSEVATLCAADAVFRSPLAFTPYEGAPVVAQFLQQAAQTIEDFRYHRTFVAGDNSAVLEFSGRVQDKVLKGVDIITFDAEGRITEFEVMVRPATGLQALGAEMTRRMAPILTAAKSA